MMNMKTTLKSNRYPNHKWTNKQKWLGREEGKDMKNDNKARQMIKNKQILIP